MNTPLRQSYANPITTSAMNAIAPANTIPRPDTVPSATAASMPAADRLATAHGLDPDAQRLELDLLRGVIRVLPAAPDPEPAP